MSSRREIADALAVLQILTIEIENHDELTAAKRAALAAAGRRAFQYLAAALQSQLQPPRGRGRSSPSRGIGRWQHDGTLDDAVRAILRTRDVDDPQTMTECYEQLLQRSAAILPPRQLSPAQCRQLKKLTSRAKPVDISRNLQAWIFDLPLRTVRRLRRTKVADFRWF